MPIATTTGSRSASVQMSPTAHYALTALGGFVIALLLLGAIWLLVRCRRDRTAPPNPSSDQWIPFKPPAGLSGDPELRRVQPETETPLIGLKKSHPIPARRQSVPVLPTVYAAHAVSAMAFTQRRFSNVSEIYEEDRHTTESEASRRYSVTSPPRRRSSTCPSPGEVDRAMYGLGPEASLNAHGLGKLCFSLRRCGATLLVKVHKATYLSVAGRAKEYGDFHVEVTVKCFGLDPCTTRTRVVRNIRNPVFEQEFSFRTTLELQAATINFVVKERRQTVIGEVFFPLEDVRELLLDNDVINNIWRDITRPEKARDENENLGMAYLSLSYNPPKSRLSVGIIKCRGLSISSQDSSIFCRVTAMSAEKVLKDERSQLVKQNLSCPLVEQEFQFYIDSTQMSDVCLSVTVWGKRNFGFNNFIGKCVLGPVAYADGEGLMHWSTMMNEPQKIIHQWHSLK